MSDAVVMWTDFGTFSEHKAHKALQVELSRFHAGNSTHQSRELALQEVLCAVQAQACPEAAPS